jgi:hypothetical protein
MEAAIYSPNEIAKCFFECFDSSAIQTFRAFIKRHPHVRKWMICADFSLHNKKRPLDCFAFTIVPYDAWPNEIEKDASALPKDLKKSKSLDEKAIEWLREPRRFHLAITVNANPAIFSSGPSSKALTIAREYIEKTACRHHGPRR